MLGPFQVRTLEKALEKEFDPDRHAEGWTNLDLIEDREDFIDLAKVIKQVPGKSPTQVKATACAPSDGRKLFEVHAYRLRSMHLLLMKDCGRRPPSSLPVDQVVRFNFEEKHFPLAPSDNHEHIDMVVMIQDPDDACDYPYDYDRHDS